MRNKNGMQVSATDFGGHLVSVLAPDRDGKLADVILGYGESLFHFFPHVLLGIPNVLLFA